MTPDDLEQDEFASWAHQQQLERRQREEELIDEMREKYVSFRVECDAFHADFQTRNRNLTK